MPQRCKVRKVRVNLEGGDNVRYSFNIRLQSTSIRGGTMVELNHGSQERNTASTWRIQERLTISLPGATAFECQNSAAESGTTEVRTAAGRSTAMTPW